MIDLTTLKPRYVTDETGKKIEVILPIRTFLQLMEDFQDLTVRDKRKNENSVSHQQLLEELRTDGLL